MSGRHEFVKSYIEFLHLFLRNAVLFERFGKLGVKHLAVYRNTRTVHHGELLAKVHTYAETIKIAYFSSIGLEHGLQTAEE